MSMVNLLVRQLLVGISILLIILSEDILNIEALTCVYGSTNYGLTSQWQMPYVNLCSCTKIIPGNDDSRPFRHAVFDEYVLSGETETISRKIEIRCNAEWESFGNSKYYINHVERVTFDDAQAICQELDSNLVSIHSQEEQDYLAGKTEPYPSNEWFAYWIGFNDREVQQTFVWNDGSKTDFTNWYPGEPDNNLGVHDCGGIAPAKNNMWLDMKCDKLLPYICKK